VSGMGRKSGLARAACRPRRIRALQVDRSPGTRWQWNVGRSHRMTRRPWSKARRQKGRARTGSRIPRTRVPRLKKERAMVPWTAGGRPVVTLSRVGRNCPVSAGRSRCTQSPRAAMRSPDRFGMSGGPGRRIGPWSGDGGSDGPSGRRGRRTGRAGGGRPTRSVMALCFPRWWRPRFGRSRSAAGAGRKRPFCRKRSTQTPGRPGSTNMTSRFLGRCRRSCCSLRFVDRPQAGAVRRSAEAREAARTVHDGTDVLVTDRCMITFSFLTEASCPSTCCPSICCPSTCCAGICCPSICCADV